MAVQVMGWTRSGLFEVIRPRSGPSLSERLTERRERVKSVSTSGIEALRAVVAAMHANPGKRLLLRAPDSVLRWLGAAGRARRAEAEARLGGTFETERAPELATGRFEVVAGAS
jgi:Ribonuclease G/E